MIQNELSEILQKQKYLELKRRDIKTDNNQSNIQSNNKLDLSQIYSMDSSMLGSSSAFFNNAPQIYVMESEGQSELIPFTAGASSNSSSGSFMEMDYSTINTEMLDAFKLVKLSSG